MVFNGNETNDAEGNNILDWEAGTNFCNGDEEFYKEMLQAFLDSHYDMELQDFYKASDFENYCIKSIL